MSSCHKKVHNLVCNMKYEKIIKIYVKIKLCTFFTDLRSIMIN